MVLCVKNFCYSTVPSPNGSKSTKGSPCRILQVPFFEGLAKSCMYKCRQPVIYFERGLATCNTSLFLKGMYMHMYMEVQVSGFG